MLLKEACEVLGWPTPQEIFEPEGSGAKILAQLASEKIGRTLSALPDGQGVEVGILTSNPEATEAPLAIICSFPQPVQEQTLYEAQRLAWNFSRTLLLITIEPHIIRTWSCYEVPVSENMDATEIHPSLRVNENGRFDEQAAASLHWVELLSGRYFQERDDRFPQNQRAPQMLLSNLKEARRALRDQGLADLYSHALLARIIFVQFLFHRKDAAGVAALSAEKLKELYLGDVLSASYTNLADILSDYEDAYSLFRWLNQKFNGDLFPGKGQTLQEQEEEWREEQKHVKRIHLELLATFVRGDMVMSSGQKCLWPMYAFEAIPLDLISSIYEEFVNEGVGIHYTPGHLVDFMLDQVLPWNSAQWDLKILDPACGSGIFLVKTYQRLIHRWKYANGDKQIPAEVLKQLLEHNIFGVDSDGNAIRVSSFSLYLAMCDEIDPRSYWSRPDLVYFPRLRNERLIESDFFAENVSGIRTDKDEVTYDIVIGNPPWGDNSASKLALEWKDSHGWTLGNKDMGLLFVAKSVSLTKPGGTICLIQSASALLYNVQETTAVMRRRIFTDFRKVESVVNLAAFKLFEGVSVPACILMLRNMEPNGEHFWYMCPKPRYTGEDEHRIALESQDIHRVRPQETVTEPWIWSTLMWGGNRDRALLARLKQNSSIESLKQTGILSTRQGIILGDKKKKQSKLIGRWLLPGSEFKGDSASELNPAQLVPIDNSFRFDARTSTDLSAFELPQLIIKTSWVKSVFRYQARLVTSTPDGQGIICSRSFISVHTPDPQDRYLLEASYLAYSSHIATYYMLLTSGRFAFDRAEPLIDELRSLPIPTVMRDTNILGDISSKDDVDLRANELYDLQEVDIILVEDLNRYTLPNYKMREKSPGLEPTQRTKSELSGTTAEPELAAFCDTMIKVLKAAYGADKFVGAVIQTDLPGKPLPVRMVSIFLNSPSVTEMQVAHMTSAQLRERLTKIYMRSRTEAGTFSGSRCVRAYEAGLSSTTDGPALAINIVKPDQMYYWTRSAALREADTIAADIRIWAASSQAIDNIIAPESNKTVPGTVDEVFDSE